MHFFAVLDPNEPDTEATLAAEVRVDLSARIANGVSGPVGRFHDRALRLKRMMTTLLTGAAA